MSRPIRDFETRTAPTGDAPRAVNRFSDGYDWVERGFNDLERAGGDITRVIAGRIEATNRLEDATAKSEANSRLRLGVSERLRGLDPRAPDYDAQAAQAFEETLAAVVDSTPFRSSEVRDLFRADAASVRTQVALAAAETRERAVIDAAKQQYELAIGRAAATIALNPGARDLALLEMERDMGPVLQTVRPEVRDELVRRAQSATAEEAARGFITARDFRSAEAALKEYGGQGLLTPQAVRQIRAGLETEKRQAAAEGRQRLREAENDVRGLLLEGDLAGGNRLLQQYVDQGLIPRGSTNHQRLQNTATRMEGRARDQGATRINESLDRIRDGVGTSRDERTLEEAFNDQQRAAAERRLAAMGPDGDDPNTRQQVFTEAARRAADLTIQTLLDARPDRTPATLTALVEGAANRQDTGERAAVGERIMRVAGHNPGAVQEALRKDPALAIAIDSLQADGLPVTAQTIGTRLATAPTATRSAEDWNRTTRGSTATVRPDALLQAAQSRAIPSDVARGGITGAQQDAMREDMERAWRAGFEPEAAADFAARRFAGQHHISNAGTRPIALRRENAPATYFPRDLTAQYEPEFIERRIAALALPPSVRGEYDVAVVAVPVIVDGQQRTAFVAERQHKRNGTRMPVLAADGQPWRYIVPRGSPGQIADDMAATFKLREVREETARREREGAITSRPVGGNLTAPSVDDAVDQAPRQPAPSAITNQPVGSNLRAPSGRAVLDTILGRTPQ